MIHKLAMLSFCLFTPLAFVSPAMAQGTVQQAPAAGPINWTKVWEKVRLTTTQQDKINKIRLEHAKQATQLKAQINAMQAQIQRQLISPAPNPQLLNRLLQEKLALEARLQGESVASFLAMRKVLSPSQVVWFNEAIKSQQGLF